MSEDVRSWLLDTWPDCKAETVPFPYWMPQYALPEAAALALATMDVDAPRIDDTQGKRETHNATRWFLSPEHRKGRPACEALATAFQNPDVAGMLQSLTGTTLSGTSLRIEYCQDRSGFWLEPHTDIGAKRFTALIYLTDSSDGQSLGTDLYNCRKQYLGHAPGVFNSGLVFVPGVDTWHGFRKRVFDGVRTSIIINYVGQEWRARHELAFPDLPVTAS